ncbi:hypothetical protein [Methylobacterium sp. Leaf112]|uniref:hypothetical protein n=1 Tax=Methylobacterium sp. Leaf112 TaxID=1736258 RepID=UPI0006F34EAC|nr:hypothetical protein [Methylobacterium sp. Leaf112]KQP65221.1 hypothetical protein ASF52_20070 [Methylobacterium sp. Leaf112]
MRFALPWRRIAPPAGRAIGALATRFESLGDNCEFGLVQRYCGVEPLGLFRFSSVEHAALIDALETDFRHYGAADDLEILASFTGRLYVRSRRYGFAYNTSDFIETTAPETIHRREIGKVAYLKRRLLEDLACGEKILVRKGDTDGQADALARAIRRHGPAPLLNVRAAQPGDPSGRAEARDSWLAGHVRRFAPYETAYEIDLESWVDLMTDADGLVRARGLAAPAPVLPNLLTGASGRAVAHVLGTPTDGVCVFGARQRTDRLDPNAVHVFSAWVWVPASFRGERVGAAIGHFRLGWRDADLDLRECWQRVWVAARMPDSYRDLMMGLVVVGPVGDRLWSAGRRLEAAPLPGPAPQPWAMTMGLGPGL